MSVRIHRLAPVLATLPLFAGIFALALAVDEPGEAVSILYAIPIAVVAIERGPWAGVTAGFASLGLFAVSLAFTDDHVSALGFVTRGIGFSVLGGLLGHYATSLRAANSLVLAREDQLRSIVDNTTSVIYVKDPEGRYLLVNRRFEDLFHVTGESVIGKLDSDVFPQYLADAFRANDRRVIKERRTIEFEEEAPQDDGSHTYISVKFPLTRPGEEDPYAICGVSTDITTRKRMEKELRESKERFRQIIDAANDAFVSIKETGEVVAWNRAAETMFGRPSQEAIGRQAAEMIFAERYRPLCEDSLRSYLETGKSSILNKRIEVAGRRRDGSEFPIELTMTCTRVPGGHRFDAFVRAVSATGDADRSYLIERERSGV